jgi:hypothetical protein
MGHLGSRSVTRVTLFVMATLVIAACGIGSNDDLFGVLLINNLGQTVVERACSDASCSSSDDSVTLPPGRTTQDPQDPDGVLRATQVTTLSGQVLGCLPYRFSKTPPKELTVYVSQAVPCGDSGGTEAVNGGDWPSSQY